MNGEAINTTDRTRAASVKRDMLGTAVVVGSIVTFGGADHRGRSFMAVGTVTKLNPATVTVNISTLSTVRHGVETININNKLARYTRIVVLR